MSAEHDEILTIETTLRSTARSAGPLEDELLALLDDLSDHAALEEDEVFPRSLELVSPHTENRYGNTRLEADEREPEEYSKPMQHLPR